MTGEPVTRPYADLPIEEIELRGRGTRNMLLAEQDPWKARVMERQLRELQEEWKIKRHDQKAGEE